MRTKITGLIVVQGPRVGVVTWHTLQTQEVTKAHERDTNREECISLYSTLQIINSYNKNINK